MRENKKVFGSYISVICQIREVGNVYYTLGNRFSIDVSIEKDISDYANYVQIKWFMLDNNRYNPNLALSIIFNFTNTNQKDYTFKINKLRILEKKKSEVNLDFREDLPSGFPLNTNYVTWGSKYEILSSDTIRINNLYIDVKENLNRYIDVNFISYSDRFIKVYIKDSGINVTSFTDKIINVNDFNRFVGDKTYHIKNNMLQFMYE